MNAHEIVCNTILFFVCMAVNLNQNCPNYSDDPNTYVDSRNSFYSVGNQYHHHHHHHHSQTGLTCEATDYSSHCPCFDFSTRHLCYHLRLYLLKMRHKSKKKWIILIFLDCCLPIAATPIASIIITIVVVTIVIAVIDWIWIVVIGWWVVSFAIEFVSIFFIIIITASWVVVGIAEWWIVTCGWII